MAKAVLVMDMPKNCSKCELCCSVNDYGSFNGYCIPDDFKHCLDSELLNPSCNSRPSWCPLVSLPKKLGIRNRLPMYDTDTHYEQGFNACIDAISGKE